MRLWSAVAGPAAMFVMAACLAAPVAVAAGAPPVLYVDKSAAACSDSGPGSQAVPFCSIQAAANVVVPGQAVDIAAARGYGAVTITRSGIPGAPITFVGVGMPEISPTSSAPSIRVAGASDVVISSVQVGFFGSQDGIDVIGGRGITLDRLYIGEGGETAPAPAGIAIDGTSSDVTVSRSQVLESQGYGIMVRAGAQHVSVTTDFVYSGSPLAAVSVDGVTGDVTSNSVLADCGDAVAITGNAAIVAENNFLGSTPLSSCSRPSDALRVSAQAAAGVQADYNALTATAPGTEYSWAGTTYPNAAAFHAGTGQGSHDLDISGDAPGTDPPPAASPLIDSADCAAPGELTTDLQGLPHVADPLVVGTGAGSCHADRGAVELQDPIRLTFGYGPAKGLAPLTVTIKITSGATSPWNEQVSYTVDFGDGSAPAAVPAGGSVSHTYTTPGELEAKITAADTGGSATSGDILFKAATPSPPSDGFSAQPTTFTNPPFSGIGTDEATFLLTSPDQWEVSGASISFGDGTSTDIGTLLSWDHLYPRPGTYTATLTVTDLLGRTSTATATATVGDEFISVGPYPDPGSLTNGGHAIGPHRVLALSMAQLNGGTSLVAGARIEVSVPSSKATGSLTVYPDGSPRPAQADLRFGPGQAASGEILAVPGPDGKVDFYNASPRTIGVGIGTTGLEVTSSISGPPGCPCAQDGDTFVPVRPVRVLDTRAPTGGVHHPLGGGRSITFSLGPGVPTSADQVVLDVTATNTRAAGWASLYPAGRARAGWQSPYWARGQTITSLLTVPMPDGEVTLKNSSTGSADFMVDMVGYYDLYGSAAVYLPVTAVLTGNGGGTVPATIQVAAKTSIRIPIAGCLGAPTPSITAISAKVLVTGNAVGGFLAAYRPGTARPSTRTLSYGPGKPAAGMALMPASSGAVEIYNGASRAVDVGVVMTGCSTNIPEITSSWTCQRRRASLPRMVRRVPYPSGPGKALDRCHRCNRRPQAPLAAARC